MENPIVDGMPRKQGRVPIMPVLSLSAIGLRSEPSLPMLTDQSHTLLTTSGRAALALVLRQLSIKPGDEVLLPAYHCVAMVRPVIASGAKPVFYKLTADLSPDEDDIGRKYSGCTRAALFVHYFGRLQDLSHFRRQCDDRSISLIEDCAHAFYGTRDGVAVGRTGDFAIGSLMKFMPIFDGGCLVSYRRPLPIVEQRLPGLRFELKSAVNVIDRAVAYEPSRSSRLINGVLTAGRRAVTRFSGRQAAEATTSTALRAAEGGVEFEPSWVDVRASASSRMLCRYFRHQRAIERRRRLYQAYLDAIGQTASGSAFYPHLDEGMVPYVFPYLLTDPGQKFDELWQAGIPLYRWEDVAGDICAVSREYRDRLIQFPCHHELSEHQTTWLLDTARRVLEAKS